MKQTSVGLIAFVSFLSFLAMASGALIILGVISDINALIFAGLALISISVISGGILFIGYLIHYLKRR